MADSKLERAYLAENGWKYDVFLLHAGENKGFVKKLYTKFRSADILPFFDEVTLELGDNAQEMIMDALRCTSRFIVPILTHEIKGKPWPEMEISEALERHMKHKVLLPVFYKITPDQCFQSSNQFVKKISGITGIRQDGEEEETFVCTVVKRIKEMVVNDTLRFLGAEEETDSGAQGGSNLQSLNGGVPNKGEEEKRHVRTGDEKQEDETQDMLPFDQAGDPVHVPEVKRMFDTVVKHGQDKWNEIGGELGFSIAEVNGLTHTHPGCDAKLRALINEKVRRIAAGPTAEILLKACKQVKIMGSVADELGLCEGQELYARQLQKSGESKKDKNYTGEGSAPSTSAEYKEIDLRSSEIPQDLISIAADLLRPEWNQLGRELGLSNEDLYEYRERYQEVKERVHQIIHAWQMREGEYATVGQLLAVCDKLKRNLRPKARRLHGFVFC